MDKPFRAIERVQRRVSRRYAVNLLLRLVGYALAAAGVLAVLAVLADRLVAVRMVNRWLGGVLGAGAALAVAAAWVLKRPRRMQIALLIDQRLGLKERFSTVLALAGRDDPFARAAERETRELAGRLAIRGRFPVRLTGRWFLATGAWLAAAGLAAWMPQLDLLRFTAQREAEQRTSQQLQRANVEVQETAGQVKTVVQQLGDPGLNADLARLTEPTAGLSPQEVRREAIRRLDDLGEKLKQMRKDNPAASADALRHMLKRLRGLPEGPARELSQAVAGGEFDKAAELAKQLRDKLAENRMTEQEKAALQRQLADLSKRLKDLADRQQDLRDALERFAQDSDLANMDLDKLREALAKSGLTAEQIEELLQKAAACKSASAACRRLAEQVGRCAGQGQAGELSADELAELVEQLDDLEQADQRLGLVESSLDEIDRAIACLGLGDCQGGGEGQFKEGLALRQGPGTGGPGQGFGPRQTGADDGAKATDKTSVANKEGEGPAVASWYFQGDQVKGEARRQLTDVVQAAKDRAADAISDNRIPRKYESAVKTYFDQLDQSGTQPPPEDPK